MKDGFDAAALSLLKYLHTRGAYRVEEYAALDEVDWANILTPGLLSGGEEKVAKFAYQLSLGHLPNVHPVLAMVDRGYQHAVGHAVSLILQDEEGAA